MTDLWPQPSATRINLAEESDFDLGGMRVHPAELAVEMDGQRQELQPRVMKVLVALAKARPSVVSRDKLAELCWEGRIVGDDALNRCVLALRQLSRQYVPSPFAIETVPRVGHRLVETGTSEVKRQVGQRPWLLIAGALAVVVAVVALLLLAPWPRKPDMPTVMVMAAAPGSETSGLAADLTVKLGSLETARSSSLRLLAEGSSGNPDLLLEVASVADPGPMRASLVLKSGSDQSVLWSKEFEQPSGSLADLKQQIALAAARVLGCAAEASGPHPEPLSEQTVKRYLNACATQAELVGREAESVIPMFRDVLRNAPRFEAAWAKLLLADSDVLLHTGAIEAHKRLRTDLAAARTVNANLPETYLAQILLVPGSAYAERMRLVDRAIELGPANAGAYSARAQLLQSVGRMQDSVADARRAMELDPLSPGARGSHVYALAAAGFHDLARQELQTAERLWPGARSVSDVRFAFNLRYGDPAQAWDHLRKNPSEDWMNAQSYLEARATRTPEKIERAVRDAQGLYRRRPPSIQHLIQVYGEFGRRAELLELLLEAPKAALANVDLTFRAPSVAFWHDPRALLIAKRAGLLDYWRQSGEWPDFCFAPDLPYECKLEAAKIAGN